MASPIASLMMIRVFVPFVSTRNATSTASPRSMVSRNETAQLNSLTFSGMPEMFGGRTLPHSSSRAHRRAHHFGADGRHHLPHLNDWRPITFIHGNATAASRLSTARTIARLAERNGAALYERHVIADYGHIDCIFGKTAATDVYPRILAHLDKTAEG